MAGWTYRTRRHELLAIRVEAGIRLAGSRANRMIPALKPAPDLAQFQAKTFDNSLAGQAIDVHQFLGFQPWAVHIDRAPIRIDQPPERRPILDPLAHLRLRLGQPVRRGDQLHYEIRT